MDEHFENVSMDIADTSTTSVIKTEVLEDVQREFFFCAVDMDGLEHDGTDEEAEKEKQDKEKLERSLAKRRKSTAERVRKYRARKKLEAERLKLTEMANASSQSSTDDSQTQHLKKEEQDPDKQTKYRKSAAERMRKLRLRRKFEEEKLREMAASTNVTSQSSTDQSQMDYLRAEGQEQVKKPKKFSTNAERARKYRERKKMELEKLKAIAASTGPLSQFAALQLQEYRERHSVSRQLYLAEQALLNAVTHAAQTVRHQSESVIKMEVSVSDDDEAFDKL